MPPASFVYGTPVHDSQPEVQYSEFTANRHLPTVLSDEKSLELSGFDAADKVADGSESQIEVTHSGVSDRRTPFVWGRATMVSAIRTRIVL